MVNTNDVGNIVIIDVELLVIVNFLLEVIKIVALVDIFEKHLLHCGPIVLEMLHRRIFHEFFMVVVLEFLFGMFVMVQNLQYTNIVIVGHTDFGVENVHQVVDIQNDGKDDEETGVLYHLDRTVNGQDGVHDHLDKGHVHHGVVIDLLVAH